MSKLVDKDKLALLAKALDSRMKAAVEAEAGLREAADNALDGKISTNSAAIEAINHAETGILKQAKDYVDGKVEEINGVNEGLAGRLDAVEAANEQQGTDIAKNASDLAKEIEDREAAVQGVQGAIDAEVLRAQGEEERIEGKVDQEKLDREAAVEGVQGAIDAEVLRAQGEEERIEGKVDQEVLDRKAAVQEVQGALDAHKGEADAAFAAIETKQQAQDKAITDGDAATLADAKKYADEKITALVNGAPEAMNTLNELAAAINAHQDVYTAYVEQVSQNIAAVQAEVDAEELRAKGEEERIEGKVDQEVLDRKAADDALQGAIDAEVLRAQGVEDGHKARIEALEGLVGGAEEGIFKDVEDLKDKNDAQDTAIGEAQAQADKGVQDAAAAQAQADKGVQDAAAAQAQADKGVQDAATAQAGVDELKGIVGDETDGLVKDVADNAAAIEAINHAETGILKQAKDYVDGKVEDIDGDLGEINTKLGELEAKDAAQDEVIGGIRTDLNAEIDRSKLAEKANSDAIDILNGDAEVEGSVDKKIADALESYSDTAEVKAILTNVVSSLNLSLVDDKMVLKLGGVEGVTITETTLDLATEEDINAIIAGLDAE